MVNMLIRTLKYTTLYKLNINNVIILTFNLPSNSNVKLWSADVLSVFKLTC